VDKVHSAWRPGNREILYHTNRGETFLLEAGTGRERRILEGIAVRDAAWSPDGKTLAYGLPPEDKLNGKETLWISALQGRDRRQVAGAFGIDALAPIWLDGRRLLYRQCSMRDNMAVGHDFWMLDVDRVHFRNAVPGDDEPLKFDQSLSPEGILAYSSLQSGFYEIWTLDLEGGKARQLTHLEAYSGNPTWSPDGKSLAFESNKDGRTQIYRLDANGEGLKQLTRNEAPSRKPVWTPPATLARSGAQ
jgi:TolB protein